MDLSKYTPEQHDVICHPYGHAKVSAGPGSGKTHTMVGRIQFLLEQGIDPRRVLVLMFNKSAQENFKDRLEKACGALQMPEVRTYHSFGMRLCERLTKAGKLRHASLLTDEGKLQSYYRDSMFAAAKAANTPNDILYHPDTFETYLSFIDSCKACIDPFAHTFKEMKLGGEYRFFLDGIRRFEDLRDQEQFRTFADLLYDPAMTLLNDESAVPIVSERFSQIVIDEFQDTSSVQMFLLVKVAGKRSDVMVVGDIDQCIYEWRSAKPEIMLRQFDEEFQGAKHYSLTRTFRFGHRLALAANHVISANRLRDDRICVSDLSTHDTRVELMPDTVSVAAIANQWTGQGRELREIAILPRTYSMAAVIELDLLENKVPYRVVGADSVVHSRITEGFLSWAIASVDGLSRMSKGAMRAALSSMFALPPLGLTRTQVEVMLNEMVTTPSLIPDILRQASVDARPMAATNCRTRASLWQRIAHRRTGKEMAATFLELVLLETGAEEFFRRATTTASASDKLALADGLIQFCRRKALTISGFIELFGELRSRSAFVEDDAILLTSVHRAKGCEWPLTIIPSLREGCFPPSVPGRSSTAGNCEDERRLFFVALTRATERCILLHPDDDELAAAGERGRTRPPAHATASRFLYEACIPLTNRVVDALHSQPSAPMAAEDAVMSNRYLEAIGSDMRIQSTRNTGSQTQARRTSPFTDPSKSQSGDGHEVDGVQLTPGQRVHHPAFGDGKITSFLQDGKLIVVGFGPGYVHEKWLQAEAAVRAGLRPL